MVKFVASDLPKVGMLSYTLAVTYSTPPGLLSFAVLTMKHTVLSAVPDVSQSGISPFDYIICATKNTPDVSTPVAELIRTAVTPGHSTILLLQNGLNIEVPLFEAFPDNVILSGISICGSSEPESGTIEHNLHDELRIGPFRDVGSAAERAKDIVSRYNAGGRCTCHYDSNVTFSRWKKLLYNAVYNPVGALTNLDTGDIQLCPGLVDEVVRPGMKEIQAIAATYGQEIKDEMIEATITTEPIEAHVPPSMLVDVRKVGAIGSLLAAQPHIHPIDH